MKTRLTLKPGQHGTKSLMKKYGNSHPALSASLECPANPKPHKECKMINQHDKNQAHATISDLYPNLRKISLFVALDEVDPESEPH